MDNINFSLALISDLSSLVSLPFFFDLTVPWSITAKDTIKSLFNILPLKNHQSISSIMALPENESEWKNLKIIFATSKGKIRKKNLEDF